MKKIWINVFWGLLVVSFWLYQVFWPLFWNPISKFLWHGRFIQHCSCRIRIGDSGNAERLWTTKSLNENFIDVSKKGR